MGLFDQLRRPPRPVVSRSDLPNRDLAATIARDPNARGQIRGALLQAPRYRDAVQATRHDWVAVGWELDGLEGIRALAAVGPDLKGRLVAHRGEGPGALTLLAELLHSGRALIAPALKRDEETLLASLPASGRTLWRAALWVDPTEAVDLLLAPPTPAGPGLARAAGEPGGLALAARELTRQDPRSRALAELISASKRREPMARARLTALAWRDVLAPRLAPFAGALDERG